MGKINGQKKIETLTFIASSSVVSSPAKMTFTFSGQLSPNSARKIYNAASPITHFRFFLFGLVCAFIYGNEIYTSKRAYMYLYSIPQVV